MKSANGTYNHVHLPVDRPEQRWNEEGQQAVPDPVRGGSEGDCFGANFRRIDFGGIGPRSRADGSGERTHEQVGQCDNRLSHGGVVGDRPRNSVELGIGMRVGRPKPSLQSTFYVQENSLEEESNQNRGASAKFIEVDNGR